jgi:hypothetical protein
VALADALRLELADLLQLLDGVGCPLTQRVIELVDARLQLARQRLCLLAPGEPRAAE